MARIKRKGLDYFPLDTDFIHNRMVRRIMKREGDGAFTILLAALSCIYAGEGYYVRADELFYEDLSSSLYQQSGEDVRRILNQAVEYGLFDSGLLRDYGILTSAEIQRQYLFSTRRRRVTAIDPRYSLVDENRDEEQTISSASTGKADGEASEKATEGATGKATRKVTGKVTTDATADVLPTGKNVTFKPENVTSGTHSIAQHSTSQHNTSQQSTAHPPHDSPVGERETVRRGEDTDVPSMEEEYLHKIAEMKPPHDGIPRNLEGLILTMRQFRISPQEQYAIILKTNFGAIGHPLWKGFSALRCDHGKIRQPGRYLLSLCYTRRGGG